MTKQSTYIQRGFPKLHLLASNDDLRPAMQYIEVKNGIATVTDAHILIRHDVSDWISKYYPTMYLHKNTWRFIAESRNIKTIEIDNDGNPSKVSVSAYTSRGLLTISQQSFDGKYPDYLSIVRGIKDYTPAPDFDGTIGLNVNYLLWLNKAIDTSRLKMFAKDKNKAIKLEDDGRKWIGIQMPIMCFEESNTDRFYEDLEVSNG